LDQPSLRHSDGTFNRVGDGQIPDHFFGGKGINMDTFFL
jgi:hypothetical protein